jgi:DnaD/phage-associated family protein
MNYFKQLNAFWNWRQLNSINSTQAELYLALLHFNNFVGWSSEFNVPNSTLLLITGISSKDTLNNCRNKLVQIGLITYQKGKRGKAGVYTIIKLYKESIDINNRTNNATNNIINPKNRTNNQSINPTNNATNSIPYINNNNIIELTTTTNVVDNNVFSYYQQNIGMPPPTIVDAIVSWQSTFTDDIIMLAIKKATFAEKRSWSYINGILNNWQRSNVKVIADIQTLDKKHEKTNKTQKSNPTKNKFINYEQRTYDFDKLENKAMELLIKESGGI